MRQVAVICVALGVACAKTLPIDQSPCPCDDAFQCCGNVCVPTGTPCESGDDDQTSLCAIPGNATTACGGTVCPASNPCLTSIATSADGECCASNDCAATVRLAVDVLQRTAPIVIDGELGDWAAAERHALTRSPLTPESPDDLSANFSTMWDQSALYLLVEVRDDVFVPADSGADFPYFDDGIEIFLDIEPDNLDSGHREGFAHYFVTSTATLYEDGGETAQNWIATIVVQHNDGLQRWWIEMSLTWPPGYAPAAGAVLGFDVAVNDDDTVGPPTGDDREGQLFWNDGSGTAASDPHLLGIARLLGCGA